MKFIVSTPPHCHDKSSVPGIHFNIILALLPAVIFGIFTYGIHALRVYALSISVALISEIIIRKLFKRSDTSIDGSAILIGLLFAMLLPSNVPYWLVIMGSFLCIFIGKEIFGGLGSNPLNPILVGWTITRVSWPEYFNFDLAMVNYDTGFSFRYPLTLLKNGGTEIISDFKPLDLLLGKQVGGIGAAAIGLLFIGGLYLLIRKKISWEIPVSFILGVVVMSFIFWASDSSIYANPFFHLLTGNVMIGAFFLSTDFASSPSNRWGMIVFGLSCGIIAILLRAWSIYPDGVVFAIMIMNLFTPLLDKIKGKPKSLKISYLGRRLS
jgi:electron transport complex protein RnfD